MPRIIKTERTIILYNNSEAREVQNIVKELGWEDYKLVKQGEPVIAPFQNIIILDKTISDIITDDSFIPNPKIKYGTEGQKK